MSRWDDDGMMWQDVYATTNNKAVRARPPVPDTGWVVPKEFPNLSAAKMLAIDTETKDMGLQEGKGPGQYRGDGYICGMSVATDDGHAWYFPMRHLDDPDNLDPDKVLAWARDELARENQSKLGANLKYDLEWLAVEGVEVKGELHDILLAEPLIDETQYRFNMDSCGEKYLGRGKVDTALYEWCAAAFGGPPDRKQAGNIWRAPAKLVGPYAEWDVLLPFEIFEHQKKILEDEELWELYRLECRLLPMLVAMRQRGVRVDINKLPSIEKALADKAAECKAILDSTAGFTVSDTATELARAFEGLGLPITETGKGNPSFAKTVLQAINHPIGQQILDFRKYTKAKGTFIDGYMAHAIDGRIHAEFNQLKSDDGGTVARFSSSNPNLQNIPARDKELKKYCRRLFIPEDGCRWRRFDYSQIEYRYYVHYGRGPSADSARSKYRNDPTTDFHQMTIDLIKSVTGQELERKPAKNINFGLGYGMGKPKLAAQIGISLAEAEELFEAYHAGVPFIKQLAKRASAIASARGYVKTILGRRGRFTMWEAKDWELAQIDGPVSYQYALDQYGKYRMRRAGTHKALSRVIQGSAADLMKKSMVDTWEAGVYEVIDVPELTVHDELDFNDPQTKESEEAFGEVKRIMENCLTLKVPIIVEQEVGPNWGELIKLEV